MIAPLHYSSMAHRIVTRFTAADAALVASAAAVAHVATSAFVRGATLDAARDRLGRPASTLPSVRTLADDDRRAILAAQLELRAIGRNLNQLTRLAHRGQVDLAQLGPIVADLSAGVEELAVQLGTRP
ncbi:plasmid mobilization relaxosome protein MobC [Cryobacterium sp. RTS3]|uniref:plasmid mobilization relaxosome protein MobC n=1 Tax=Cryobacterium sp. RTS3 TaxID=3048643 RepID=UPI002B23105D|nr:plasmid mobilization relaxosome protein MobC [Cryobacterium sp. RTS3]MEA9998808.1 plasmid mobilization relaxosome protein MobC [Cryobacterium sp. RTS3]